MDNDFSPVANSSCDNCCGSPVLTVHLPPVDVTCDPVSDKTRKARRKAAKDKHADNWKYCVKNCVHNGKDNHQMVQCHMCQAWVHPECVGEDDKDIIGIWSCTSCRMLPTLVERLLEKTSMLESLVVKLERSNQQLVSLMGEQSQEIRRLREDIATSKRQNGDADSNDGGPQAVTLLVGNSLLRDVRVDKTSSGNPIKIRRKSGATLADIEQMIDDAAKTETIDEIFIVGGTHETTSDVSAANIKENIAQILRKAKTLTPTITVSSVLPSKRPANPDRRADVNMKMKEACNEVDVKFVDNDANFTFRNGAADDAAFQRDGLHLSESGVGRLLLNLSLPEQPPKQNKHQQQHRHVSNATNHDRLPNARVAPDGKWTVVKRRTRLSMGKCAKCGETNHVTATCRHPDKVLCRQCGERGHKEKHHSRV